MPFYNVPDLEGFKLKPYVPHSTPMILDEKKNQRIVALSPDLMSKIENQIEEASRGRLETVDSFKNMKR